MRVMLVENRNADIYPQYYVRDVTELCGYFMVDTILRGMGVIPGHTRSKMLQQLAER